LCMDEPTYPKRGEDHPFITLVETIAATEYPDQLEVVRDLSSEIVFEVTQDPHQRGTQLLARRDFGLAPYLPPIESLPVILGTLKAVFELGKVLSDRSQGISEVRTQRRRLGNAFSLTKV